LLCFFTTAKLDNKSTMPLILQQTRGELSLFGDDWEFPTRTRNHGNRKKRQGSKKPEGCRVVAA